MKKTLFVILIYMSASLAIKAQVVNISYEKNYRGFVLYADNAELYPVSLTLNLNLLNLSFSQKDKKVFVIPAKKQKFVIGELITVTKSSETKFTYTYRTCMGDATLKKYDTAFVYDLPFQKGKSFLVYQGYNGSFSHQNENALDFAMPEGTEVLAARDGIVVEVVTNNTISCATEECKQYNNRILIIHSDGTFGNYAHIKYNGSDLKAGDHVKKGDVIAWSGNVGWSNGPHLHFACFLGGFDQWQSVATRFRIDKGDSIIMLQEGNHYLRDY